MYDAPNLPSVPVNRIAKQKMSEEETILGVMMSSPAVIDDIIGVLPKPEMFSCSDHQAICRVVYDLHRQRITPDAATVYSQLKRDPTTAKIGGDVMMKIAQSGYVSPNWRYYAEQVRTWFILRSIRAAAAEVESIGSTWTDDPQDAIAGVERVAHDVSSLLLTDRDMTRFGDELTTLLNDLEGPEPPNRGVYSGLPDLDDALNGFQPGEVTLLAARTSVGKSTIAMNFVRHFGKRGQRIAMFSLEVNSRAVTHRILGMEAAATMRSLRPMVNSQHTVHYITEAAARLRPMQLWLKDISRQTISQIAASCRRMRRQRGLDVVVIDYLQLIEPDNRKVQRHEQVSQISRDLKLLARELDVPIIALCQVNRGSEERSDRRPRLSDLRESGSLEQDADNVLILHRPTDGEQGDVIQLELDVAKNRFGPTTKINLVFNRATGVVECQAQT